MTASSKKEIYVVGGGLAGSECTLQLASKNYVVHLYEMKPVQFSEAHKSRHLAEIVCSNSFGSQSEGSAPHQLKWEADRLNSFILNTAKLNAVPAGQALSVDRERFAADMDRLVRSHPNIIVHEEVVKSLDQLPRPLVVATGPLTAPTLAASLQEHFGGQFLYFFDAIAPIIDTDSINMDICWKADRYGKGSDDYINCPFNKEQYWNFVREIEAAKKIEPKDFEKTNFFEGCMPIETMVERGLQTPRFGPMKPVGLPNPKTQRDEYAIVQLRQDNKEATAYNMVGFQTRMTYSEQVRVFRMIPGLENAEFLKLGSIHRNLFINTPSLLNKDLSSRKDPWLFFAGQITGVEGYFESTCTGIMVARFLDDKLNQRAVSYPPRASAMGSILEAITDETRAKHFQPTNINFGLLPPIEAVFKDKKLKKDAQIQRARNTFSEWLNPQAPQNETSL
ncbi:MAG: methylenetetrahydrofolate--tRNA-(uracil(54)-C(5))-methyltransferase (FADH(2)-oxidizing) TrmFO [Bdellovibrionaceae bacterium]|nr:methylenetetrahydrofolate--tRNA-(uracil(54)-C(5))-methyltransferase (FADH(2)-oxidizing) TrmFO [Pseudobdellovibrionaceae bacterium]